MTAEEENAQLKSEGNHMAEQLPERAFEQRRMIVPTICIVLGIIFLVYSAFIFVFRVGFDTTIISSNGSYYAYPASEFASFLRLLDGPTLLIGLGLFLIGLINRTKKHSLRRLSRNVTTLGVSLMGFGVIVALLMIFAHFIGSALFP
jgi:hypothetical protein